MLPVLIPYGSEDDPAFGGDNFPWSNWTLITLNVLVFLGTYFQENFREIVHYYGTTPADFRFFTLFTSMFLHANPAHLVGNMLFLFAFGRLMNLRLGNGYYPVSFVLSGVIGGVLFTLINAGSPVPAVGASGAISGVLGLFFSVAPRTKIHVWYFWWFIYRAKFGSFSVRAVWGIGVWILFQLLMYLLIGSSNVAVTAHLGGFVTGGLIGLLFHFDVLEERAVRKEGTEVEEEGEYMGRISDEKLERLKNRRTSEREDEQGKS